MVRIIGDSGGICGTFHHSSKLQIKEIQHINHFYLVKLASVLYVPIPSDIEHSIPYPGRAFVPGVSANA